MLLVWSTERFGIDAVTLAQLGIPALRIATHTEIVLFVTVGVTVVLREKVMFFVHD